MGFKRKKKKHHKEQKVWSSYKPHHQAPKPKPVYTPQPSYWWCNKEDMAEARTLIFGGKYYCAGEDPDYSERA